jgi:hypothetical protein
MREYKKGKESPLFKDLTGEKFGKLTAKNYIYDDTKKYKKHMWICDCDCGNEAKVRTNELTKGERTQCKQCSINEVSKTRTRPDNGALITRVIKQYKAGAKRRGYEFLLTDEKLKELIFSNCYYCGEEPKINKGEERYFRGGLEFKRNGIDRLNNKIGYTNENVVTCCETCNRAKMCLEHDDFLTLINKIYLNLEKRSTTIPQGSTEQANGSGNGFDPSK